MFACLWTLLTSAFCAFLIHTNIYGKQKAVKIDLIRFCLTLCVCVCYATASAMVVVGVNRVQRIRHVEFVALNGAIMEGLLVD